MCVESKSKIRVIDFDSVKIMADIIVGSCCICGLMI